MKQGQGDIPREEALALLDLLDRLERRADRLARANQALDLRLLKIENSRLFLFLRKTGVLIADCKRKAGQALLHSPFHSLYLKIGGGAPEDEYRLWLEQQAAPQPVQLARQPLISIIMPVHNPRREWLEEAIASVAAQRYANWELRLCDDASAESWVNESLTARAAADPRIHFVRSAVPLGISGASNRAAEQALGEYLGFLDHDDRLSPFALERVAAAVVDCDCDLLYTDEDRIAAAGRRVQPIFRPDWSPDLLDSCMYMGHFLVVSRAAWQRAGGLRPECDGAQDYDLALRVSEGGSKVVHIPEVLYHWRLHPGSTSADAGSKPATHAAGRRALQSAMERRGREVRIEDGNIPNRYHVKPAVSGSPLASIVICSRNAATLSYCLRAIENNTSWPHREIVVVQHRTRDNSAMDALLDGIKCIRVPFAGAFNFARMNNAGAAAAHGEVLVFMNDDVTPLTPEWLELLVGHAMRPGIGAAGAKLLYPSGAIQHAGMAIGIMDGAGHPLRGKTGSPYWPWVECARNVAAITGACLAIRKRLFEESGGFDSLFPVNYNDVDLCLRLRTAGHQVIYEPAALLRHKECGTRMPGTAGPERNLFLERWSAVLEAGDPFYHPALVRDREDAGLKIE